jgi:hypothetical protein
VIEVRTLLCAPDAKARPEMTFVPLPEASGPVADHDYIDGAIELTIDGVPICDRTDRDLVDQLWAYICTMLGEFRTQDRVSTYFPDMPTELVFQRLKGGRMLVTYTANGVDQTSPSVMEDEFVEAMSSAARTAFAQLAVLVPENAASYDWALRQLTP